MTNSYIKEIDKEINLWTSKLETLKKDSNAFKTDLEAITDVKRRDKTEERQQFTLEWIRGHILGLAQSKFLYYQTIINKSK